MEIAEKEDQPDAFEASVPPGIFPNQQAAHIEAAFNKDAEGGIGDGPEPPVGDAQNSFRRVFGQRMVIDEARDGEHEHDFDVPPYQGTERRFPGYGPAGGPLGEMKNPAVPGFVDKVHAEDGESRIDGIPVARGSCCLDFSGVDVEDNGQKRDGVPLQCGEVSQVGEGELGCVSQGLVPLSGSSIF